MGFLKNISNKIEGFIDFVELNNKNDIDKYEEGSFDEITVKTQSFNKKRAISINDEDCILLNDNKFVCFSHEKIGTNNYNILRNESFVTFSINKKELLGAYYNYPKVYVFFKKNDDTKEIKFINVFNVVSKKWINGIKLNEDDNDYSNDFLKISINKFSNMMFQEEKNEVDIEFEEYISLYEG